MSTIEFSAQVVSDFDRIFDHVAQFNLDQAGDRVQEILDAIQFLARNPS
ncbi:MAG: type II toxin-antitoxin system RelE/ParE family toxin [Burkholderiaceae bacterium]